MSMTPVPTAPSATEHWLDSLQASGYRLTGPRRALAAIMAESGRALSPLELFDLGRAQYPGLGLVTVYRTLDKLEALGLVQRVHHPNGCHLYLRAAQGHEHVLLCMDCGQAQFFSGDDLAGLMANVAARSGFEVREHWLQLFGACPLCREATRSKT